MSILPSGIRGEDAGTIRCEQLGIGNPVTVDLDVIGMYQHLDFIYATFYHWCVIVLMIHIPHNDEWTIGQWKACY